jgi:hypothetical protein
VPHAHLHGMLLLLLLLPLKCQGVLNCGQQDGKR